jgi:hypothetical protein
VEPFAASTWGNSVVAGLLIAVFAEVPMTAQSHLKAGQAYSLREGNAALHRRHYAFPEVRKPLPK